MTVNGKLTDFESRELLFNFAALMIQDRSHEMIFNIDPSWKTVSDAVGFIADLVSIVWFVWAYSNQRKEA